MKEYIVVFEKKCDVGCGDKIIMLCRAISLQEAEKLVMEQRSNYYKDWSVSISEVKFGYDNIAYMMYIQG